MKNTTGSTDRSARRQSQPVTTTTFGRDMLADPPPVHDRVHRPVREGHRRGEVRRSTGHHQPSGLRPRPLRTTPVSACRCSVARSSSAKTKRPSMKWASNVGRRFAYPSKADAIAGFNERITMVLEFEDLRRGHLRQVGEGEWLRTTSRPTAAAIFMLVGTSASTSARSVRGASPAWVWPCSRITPSRRWSRSSRNDRWVAKSSSTARP